MTPPGPQEPLQPFRTDGMTLDRLERLEAVREAAKAFLFGLDSDPGYAFKSHEALRAALVRMVP